MTLRVMTYNIKTGGLDGRAAHRLAAVRRVVERQAPDLLALQELRDFDRRGGRRLAGFAAAVGMRPVLGRSLLGQPVGLLVRPPGRITGRRELRWGLHHAAVAVDVATDGGTLTAVSAHLNPFSPRRRVREARRLAARCARPDGLVLVMGDLNALDPWTGHEQRLATLHSVYRRRHLGADGAPDTSAVAALSAAGFQDLWRVAGDGGAGLTVPTTQGGGREFAGMRLDYLLGSAPVARLARACRVVTGGESEHASDHYPVVAELALSFG